MICDHSSKRCCTTPTCRALFEGRASPQNISLTHLCTALWRKLLHIALVHLVTSHHVQKSRSVDAPLRVSVCCHVSSVTPLNGFDEPKLDLGSNIHDLTASFPLGF